MRSARPVCGYGVKCRSVVEGLYGKVWKTRCDAGGIAEATELGEKLTRQFRSIHEAGKNSPMEVPTPC